MQSFRAFKCLPVILIAAVISACGTDEGNPSAQPNAAALMLSDDFKSGLDKWKIDEDDQYDKAQATPGRVDVVDAPGRPGSKAVRFTVPNNGSGAFRSELEQRSETGFKERWYGERVFISNEWDLTDATREDSILIQWHGLTGNYQPTFPNLSIAIWKGDWYVNQSTTAARSPVRSRTLLARVDPGKWVSWVLHARWTSHDDGFVEIWKDGQLVYEKAGPNAYGDIGFDYTPYLQTGIYRPEWRTGTTSPVVQLQTYITDVKIGDETATYIDVVPEE